MSKCNCYRWCVYDFHEHAESFTHIHGHHSEGRRSCGEVIGKVQTRIKMLAKTRRRKGKYSFIFAILREPTTRNLNHNSSGQGPLMVLDIRKDATGTWIGYTNF